MATYHMLGLRADSDIMYNPIPLYHMAGGMVGTGCALVKGIPSVLRTKFSVSAYWTDCIKYNCTVSQRFIGVLRFYYYYKCLINCYFSAGRVHWGDVSISFVSTVTS